MKVFTLVALTLSWSVAATNTDDGTVQIPELSDMDLHDDFEDFMNFDEEEDDVESMQVSSSPFGDTERFQKGIEHLFDNFDVNKDGFVNETDLAEFTHADDSGPFAQYKDALFHVLSGEFRKLDTDGDGMVSKAEFNATLAPLGEEPLPAERSLCGMAAESRVMCFASFHQRGKSETDGDVFKMRVKVRSWMCHMDATVLDDYQVEKCLIDAVTCADRVKCYDQKELATNEVSLKKRDTGSAVSDSKHDSSDVGLLILFWVSAILLGLIMIPTIILVPLYVFLVIIGWDAVQDAIADE